MTWEKGRGHQSEAIPRPVRSEEGASQQACGSGILLPATILLHPITFSNYLLLKVAPEEPESWRG